MYRQDADEFLRKPLADNFIVHFIRGLNPAALLTLSGASYSGVG